MEEDCYAYVRDYYGVPARVGMRVRAYGKEGVLTDSLLALHYVHIRFDGSDLAFPYHPTDEIEYLAETAA